MIGLLKYSGNPMKRSEDIRRKQCLYDCLLNMNLCTLCIGEKEKWLKGEKVGHGQTDRWTDGHLREKSIFL